MEERDNKTIICSVLFMDIVDYSQKAVSGQITLKEGFNVFLSTALKDIPVTDRIILDTGDGAAISFLGDIEDAFKVGLSMRESLLSAGAYMDHPLFLRMGINLGPVRLVKDINNQPNIVGDGINVAQRVMGFADVGQLLVSRSYYDAVSRISQDYAGMFHYQGSRTDKHVREHEVYAIGYPGDFTFAKKKQTRLPVKVRRIADELLQRFNKLRAEGYKRFHNASDKQLVLYVGTPLFALLFLVLGLIAWKQGQVVPDKQVVAPIRPDVSQAASSVIALAPQKNETVHGVSSDAALPIKKPEVEAAGATSLSPSVKKLEAGSLTTPVVVPVVKKTDGQAPSKDVAKVDTLKVPDKTSIAKVRTLEETTGAAAVMRLVVLPWGEVYLDGRIQGVSPPLIELQVAPGQHEIEIWNTNFPVYKQTIQVKVGEKFKIKHRFTN
jgi:hypothetical protein